MKPRRQTDFGEILSWSDSDLQRVESIRRELEASGMARAEAIRRAAITVRKERHQHRGSRA